MRGLRRTTALSGAAATAWILVMGLVAAGSPAQAAALPVTVGVTVHDTSGAPVVGWTVFGDYGPGENDYSGDVTDAHGLAELRVPANSSVALSFSVVRDTVGTPDRAPITVSAGPGGTSTTVVVPTRRSRTYTVVDPAGRPVSGAIVRMDMLVSSLVVDAVRGDYRMLDTSPFPYRIPGTMTDVGVFETAADGRTLPMAWFAPEPDAAVACALMADADRCDENSDGTPDGMFVELGAPQGFPVAPGVAVPYTQWTAAGSGPITLSVPAVPVVDVLGQRKGSRTGDVVLTVRLRRPSGASLVPAPRTRLDVVGVARDRLGIVGGGAGSALLTDARGVAEIHVRGLAGATTLAVSQAVGASAAATLTAQPKHGVGFGRVQYNAPGKDRRTRASLNKEYVSLTNTTASAISLRGWTVRSGSGSRYTFGRLTLRSGATVVLHTGPGRNTRTDRYWMSSRHLWSDTDKATLRRPSGTVAAVCAWSRTGGSTSCSTTPAG